MNADVFEVLIGICVSLRSSLLILLSYACVYTAFE